MLQNPHMNRTILGLAGALRKGSFNRRLLVACAPLMPAPFALEIIGIDGIPIYDGDVEARDGLPASVVALKERVVASAALLIATPEYNTGIPGALKNTIDWLSRPASDIPRVFGGRATGVIGASPGRFGTLSAQHAWLPVLRTLGTAPYFGVSLMVGGANAVFDDAGGFADASTRDRARDYLAGFARFVEQQLK